VGAVLQFKTTREFQTMQLKAYRSSSERSELSKIQAFRIAVTSTFQDYEPEEVTQARKEVQTWISTTAHLNQCGIVPEVPPCIFYAFQVGGYLQGVK
jgi:hypothetical protein